MITIGELFAGIGGFSLAFHAAGARTAWFVEKEPFCQKVLAKNFPGVPVHGDIYECHDLPYVDVITAGFPCQPFSLAGKRQGENDERYLVPEMLRVIQEVQPRVVLFENVVGFTSIAAGDTFKQLLRALAEMGLDAQWGHIRASDIGAPHQRERWFCVAYRAGDQRHLRFQLESDGRAHQTEQAGLGYPALVNASSQRTGTGTAGETRAAHPDAERHGAQGQPGRHTKQSGAERASQLGHTHAAGRRKHRRAIPIQPQFAAAQRAGSQRTGASLEPRVGRNFTRVSARMDGHRRIDHGTSTKAGTIEILRTLREAIDPQALQRDFRRLRSIYLPEVLRSAMCRISAAQRRSHSRRLQEARLQAQEGSLSGVQSNGKSSNPSHRWQSEKQPPLKFDDLMRFVSYEMALEQWKNNAEGEIDVQSLWRATREITRGDVPETLSALTALWRSLPDQKKAWVAVRYCQGARLTEWPWPARPGQPQFAWEPPRVVSGQPHRTQRLKALGNAVVPQCVYPIACEIVTWLEAQAREEGVA